MGVVLALGFMGAVGLLGAIAGFVQARPVRDGTVTTGRVVDVERRVITTRSDGGYRRRTSTFAPVVEFTDQFGATHRVTSPLSGGVRPEIGAEVSVSYRPDEPARARVLSGAGQSGGKWVFLVVGLACAVGAIVVATR